MRPVRQFPTLGWPSDPSRLTGFSSRLLAAGARLFRIVRKGKGPWWFGSGMDGRFDLPQPLGTCYLATDPLAALLELLGPERNVGFVSSKFLTERRLRELHLPEDIEVADVTSRQASRFGITSEIGTIVPYNVPRLGPVASRRPAFEASSTGYGMIRRGPKELPCSVLTASASPGGRGESERFRET